MSAAFREEEPIEQVTHVTPENQAAVAREQVLLVRRELLVIQRAVSDALVRTSQALLVLR